MAIWVPVWIIGAPFLVIIFSSMMFGPHSSMGRPGGREERDRRPQASASADARTAAGSTAPGSLR